MENVLLKYFNDRVENLLNSGWYRRSNSYFAKSFREMDNNERVIESIKSALNDIQYLSSINETDDFYKELNRLSALNDIY